MIALLRSDAYRVLHGRWVWALAAAVAVLSFAPALLMRWTNMGPVTFDTLTGSALSLGGIEVITAVMAAIVCCDRTDLGFGRSILSSLGTRARRVWFAEKCVFSLLLAAVTILFAFALGLLGWAVSGVPVLTVEPAWQVAAWLGCTWLVSAPYVVLTVLVAHLTRAEGVTMGFAALAAAGLLEAGLLVGLDLLCVLAGGEFLALSASVGPWLPAEIAAAVGDGAAATFSAENAASLAPAIRALVVCLPLAVAATAADALLASRRDVA